MALRTKPRAAVVHARRLVRRASAVVSTETTRVTSRSARADLAIFNAYVPPPSGGGNQFLHALAGELRGRGLLIEHDRISGRTPACLFNSFTFDQRRLRRFARSDVRMVHRVDGPIATYRGYDDGTDARIAATNARYAHATIFQSRYSLERHRELGIELVEPVVVPNAPDPTIFHAPAEREPVADRRVRVVATSWSTNPAKGGDVLVWLDRHLDHDRFELTFVGRAPARFDRITTVPPLPSGPLADILRSSDVFLTASRHEACSNALLEALACALPAVYVESGSNGELVGAGGVAFETAEEVPSALEQVVGSLEAYRAAIRFTPLPEVAERYREVLLG